MEKVFKKQVGESACGLASLRIVLDALAPLESGELRTEESILELQSFRCSKANIVSEDSIRKHGMTLEEFSTLAWNIGLPHNKIYASNIRDDVSLRNILVRSLSLGRKIVVNYHMTTAGQPPFGGHFSPLDAYDENRDCFRILDTWMKTPTMAVWVKTHVLYQAITAIDDASNKSRGFCIFVDRCGSTINKFASPNILVGKESELRLFEANDENADLYTIQEIVKVLNDGYASKCCVCPDVANFRTTEQQMRKFVQSAKHHVGILKIGESQCVGAIICEMNEDDSGAEWGFLLVQEEFKGNGFSSLLMDFAEISALSRGARRLKICIFSFEENSPLHGRHYYRKGYKAFGTSTFPEDLKSKLLPKYREEHFIDLELVFPQKPLS